VIFTETHLKGAFIVDIDRHADSRGFFARVFCQREFEEHGLNPVVAQANVAFSTLKGTMRGLHFQLPPVAETKVVRATRGAILDVIVDLRPESRTYLQHVAVELTSENHRALYVPERFAHGFQVLEPDTETTYLMGQFYAPGSEGGLRYNDTRLAIAWPLPITELSDKDAAWPLLSESESQLRQAMRVGSAASD
jgi:dTDP-4-dehydrorhamnose 3,5-epimerase